MDPLSWLLVIWVGVSAAVYFVVQNVLPLFVTPLDAQQQEQLHRQQQQQHQQQSGQQMTYGQSSTQQKESLSGLAWASAAAAPLLNKFNSSQKGETCDWLNNLLTWLHRNVRNSPDVVRAWLRAMNEASGKAAQSLGCDVFFEELISASDLSSATTQSVDAPSLNNIRAEFGPREHLTLRGSVTHPKCKVRLVASQKLPDRLVVSNYVATLTNLRGEAHVRMASIGDDLFLMLCFEGKPDVSIVLENNDKSPVERVDTSLVDEIIRRCLASAVTNVCLGKQQNFQDGVNSTDPKSIDVAKVQATTLQERQRSTRLLLKVDHADKLGGGKTIDQPYVVVELDEPAQKHTTTLGLNAYPRWEEQFLFDLNDRSEEILFETYDRRPQSDAEPRFLGLAIVGVEELRQSSNTSHTLALQGRPYRNDAVSGTLTVEFIFLRDQDDRSGKRTPYDKRAGDNRQLQVTTDGSQAGSMIKSVSQYLQSPYIDGADDELEPRHRREERRKPGGTSTTSSDVEPKPSPSAAVDRGRKRERSFFADLKRRLSFRSRRQKRAQSLEADMNGQRGQYQLDTAQDQPRSVSTPPSRDASTTRRPDHTPMTSDSEMSVTSNDSIYTQSQLVVETLDNGVKKYYLIPTVHQRNAIAKKIIKSGKKLHIYNEHTFTAVKTRPGSACTVCKAPVATAFRRKGYQCRDCGLVCHKRCHFKTDNHCPFSKVASLPIDYVRIS